MTGNLDELPAQFRQDVRSVYARDRRIWMRTRLLEALADVYGVICCRCPRVVDLTLDDRYNPDRASFDHLVALVEGGADNFGNLRLAHMRCNQEHGAKLSRAGSRGAALTARHRWRAVDGQGALW
jgi:5-methylcytosine-specific restriction endonuclease McrA